MSNFRDNDLERLFEGINLEQQEPSSGNYHASLPESQVPRFPAIRFSKGMLGDDAPSIVLEEGSDGAMQTGGGSSQDPNPVHTSPEMHTYFKYCICNPFPGATTVVEHCLVDWQDALNNHYQSGRLRKHQQPTYVLSINEQ